MIFDFLKAYWIDILLLLLIIISFIYLYKHKKYEELKSIILWLVVKAEKSLGSKTGTAKFSMVLNELYKYLPSIIKFLFTKEELEELIEEGVLELKGMLASGATLDSYAEEKFLEGELI